MDTAWFSNVSTGVFNYLHRQITGNDDATGHSAARDVLSRGVWITDLPTNNYEPLEVTHGAQETASKV